MPTCSNNAVEASSQILTQDPTNDMIEKSRCPFLFQIELLGINKQKEDEK